MDFLYKIHQSWQANSHFPHVACLHWRRRTRKQILNSMATLYYAEHVHIAQTLTRIPTPYFCTGQESESVPVSKSGNVFKSLWSEYFEKHNKNHHSCAVHVQYYLPFMKCSHLTKFSRYSHQQKSVAWQQMGMFTVETILVCL